MDGDAVREGGGALAVDGLGKTYGASHGPSGGVHGASFTLEPGAFFTLLGPSGCGKTTTLRCIAGLETPDAGRVALGERVFFDAGAGGAARVDVPMNLRRIGMVFQSYAIWPHLTVFENVAFPLRVAKERRFGREEVARLVDQALATVGLAGFGARSATRLSGGQQQRVALARAIVRQPRLLLLDEPLSNLDASLREEMRTELKRLQQQIGVTTVYVTHDQAEALDMSDRIAVMNAGRIVQMGTPREVWFRPQDAFVAGFVGATNLLRGVVEADAAAETVGAVRGDGGEVLWCAFPRPAARGARTAVSVRPESLGIAEAGAPVREGWNRLEGVVVSTGFLGTQNRYTIRVGGALLQASTPPGPVFAPGTPVSLHIAPDCAIAVPEAP